MNYLELGYIFVFGVAAIACYASTWRASRISDVETKTGLLALLLFSGTWAGASTGRLLVASPQLEATFYMIGLVVGLATVGAWLYFCSAYTGHDYHRRPGVRAVALTVFLVITGVKLTNPLHNLYFSRVPVTEPFPHTLIELHTIHWVVSGLAYALCAVGFYLLYELFAESHFDTTKLTGLVGIAGVPAVVDVLAYTETLPGVLLKFNYEPIGVAVFAIGALYVTDETFVAVPRFWRREVLEQLDEGVVVVDPEGRIRDYNDAGVAMFPGLAAGVGAPLDDVAPRLAEAVGTDDRMLELEEAETRRYYRVRTSPLSLGTDSSGRAFICTDVTDIERQRQDLERHTQQFDAFAEAITHELRNTLTVLDGYLDLVADRIDGGDPERDEVPIDQVSEAAERMQAVVGDLTTLARYGQPIDDLGECDLEEAVEAGWKAGDFDEMSYRVTSDGQIAGDDVRLEELFRNLFAFARANDASRLTVTLGDGGLTVTDDGTRLSPDRARKAIAYGEPVPAADAGMALPNVRTIARAHGWTVAVDTDYRDGVRLRLEGLEVGRIDP